MSNLQKEEELKEGIALFFAIYSLLAMIITIIIVFFYSLGIVFPGLFVVHPIQHILMCLYLINHAVLIYFQVKYNRRSL